MWSEAWTFMQTGTEDWQQLRRIIERTLPEHLVGKGILNEDI